MTERLTPHEQLRPTEILNGIKAVVVDWDDTVTESFNLWCDIIAAFFEAEGLERPTAEAIRRTWGKTIIDIFLHLGATADDEFLARYNQYVPHDFEVRPLTGADEALFYLKQKGFFLGVVTSSARQHLERCLGRTLIVPSDFFHFVLTVEENQFKKPDPRVFNLPLELLLAEGVNHSEVVYVGDSLGDYHAATGAGLQFIAVTTGVISREEFMAAGVPPERILSSLAELFES